MGARGRDGVWMLALNKTIRHNRHVRPGDMADELNVSERTIREVLNVMARNGWLNRMVDDDGRVKFGSPDGVEYTG
jgi:Mn-dependent DtxR family transcriptional regulator